MVDELAVDSIVALHNVSVKVIQGRMRLAFGKWSSVNKTTCKIGGDILTDPNFSQVDYKYTGIVGGSNE